MLTLEDLREWGADTSEGMTRCMNNEAFYLRMVGMIQKDTQMEELEQALMQGDLRKAFEKAHALKGVLANLALKPALKPISEMTELLRASTQMDYTPLLTEAKREMTALLALMK